MNEKAIRVYVINWITKDKKQLKKKKTKGKCVRRVKCTCSDNGFNGKVEWRGM